jgi:hypothetical protein
MLAGIPDKRYISHIFSVITEGSGFIIVHTAVTTERIAPLKNTPITQLCKSARAIRAT